MRLPVKHRKHVALLVIAICRVLRQKLIEVTLDFAYIIRDSAPHVCSTTLYTLPNILTRQFIGLLRQIVLQCHLGVTPVLPTRLAALRGKEQVVEDTGCLNLLVGNGGFAHPSLVVFIIGHVF